MIVKRQNILHNSEKIFLAVDVSFQPQLQSGYDFSKEEVIFSLYSTDNGLQVKQ